MIDIYFKNLSDKTHSYLFLKKQYWLVNTPTATIVIYGNNTPGDSTYV